MQSLPLANGMRRMALTFVTLVLFLNFIFPSPFPVFLLKKKIMSYVHLLSGSSDSFWNKAEYINKRHVIRYFCYFYGKTLKVGSSHLTLLLIQCLTWAKMHAPFWISVFLPGRWGCSWWQQRFLLHKALCMVYLLLFSQYSHKAGAVVPFLL